MRALGSHRGESSGLQAREPSVSIQSTPSIATRARASRLVDERIPLVDSHGFAAKHFQAMLLEGIVEVYAVIDGISAPPTRFLRVATLQNQYHVLVNGAGGMRITK